MSASDRNEELDRYIIRHLDDRQAVARRVLLALRDGDLNGPARKRYLRFVFKLSSYLDAFQYSCVYAIVTKGQAPDPSGFGRLDLLDRLYPALSGWLFDCLVRDKPSLPPFEGLQGAMLVSRILEGVVRHLYSLCEFGAAEAVSRLHAAIDRSFQMKSADWVFSSSFIHNIGHFAYLASIIEMNRRGHLTGQPIKVRTGPTTNQFMYRTFAESLIEDIPTGTQFVEEISGFKRHRLSDGTSMRMSELVSVAATYWANDRPFAALDSATVEQGDAALAELGVAADTPIVTLHVREPGYLRDHASRMAPRDADVTSYHEAVRYLTGRGYAVVRLGDETMTPLPDWQGVIDYPFSGKKADWMDVYLAARCRFHVGTSSGMSFIPLLFARPVLFTNWSAMAHVVCAPNVVTLPKTLLGPDGERVPLAEYCNRYGWIFEQCDADLLKARFVDNTAEELRDAVRFVDAYTDPETGKLAVPESEVAEARSIFANSILKIAPTIAPAG
ncbi:MAG: TIGR04372 family glycosyltransferase [Thalassobaculum sp.]|uniref:TIGR04372 family glycosyltransferase n=1 Tax=Thalassobaculum sp. TaxID=2022740 RepID=UPI0032EDA9F8